MLLEIDRVALATPDAADAAAKWRARLGAEEVGRGRVAWLSARRTTLRAGRSDVELLEPDGEGLLADELRRRGRAHLFAAGATSDDPAATAAQAAKTGAEVRAEDGRQWIAIEIEGAPIRFVVSAPAERAPAGDLDYLYEATVLAADQAGAVDRIARTFALDPATFTTITSAAFGYTGVLTLFRPGRLHRFEVITPTDMAKTMGRYYGRERASFYMAFAESARLLEIEASAKAAGAGITLDRPAGRPDSVVADQLWLHPPTLGGMMLGVSRPTMAWTWSGAPERVEAVQG
jgi:catechol 2,3-dioxygenase-like lactoylglutathione lyase family enzyme